MIEDVILVDELKHNLLSVSLSDKGLRVIFDDCTCDILDKKSNFCVLFSFHENNIYRIDMLNLQCNFTCLNAFNEDSCLRHRSLGHVSFDNLSHMNSKEAVKGILTLKFGKDVFAMRANLKNKPNLLSNQSRKS